jgi:hypothetical protein
MDGTAMAVAIGLTTLVVVVYLREPWRAWRRFRGDHLVTCPETHGPAAVSVDVGRAAFTAFVEGRADLHLTRCSRWPERGRCDEPCVSEVDARGEAGSAASIAAEWFRSKRCAYCGAAIVSPASLERPAALLAPDAVSVAWRDVPAEQLPSLFETHQPVCWSCHHIETFLRGHKELVVER